MNFFPLKILFRPQLPAHTLAKKSNLSVLISNHLAGYYIFETPFVIIPLKHGEASELNVSLGFLPLALMS